MPKFAVRILNPDTVEERYCGVRATAYARRRAAEHGWAIRIIQNTTAWRVPGRAPSTDAIITRPSTPEERAEHRQREREREQAARAARRRDILARRAIGPAARRFLRACGQRSQTGRRYYPYGGGQAAATPILMVVYRVPPAQAEAFAGPLLPWRPYPSGGMDPDQLARLRATLDACVAMLPGRDRWADYSAVLPVYADYLDEQGYPGLLGEMCRLAARAATA